jgi:hypothetical protein
MDLDHMVVRKQIDDQDLIGKTFKDEFTLGVTSVAVNNE